jgi:uncharacterized phage-like protein YoqJ
MPENIIAVTGHRPDKLPNRETGYSTPNPTYDLVMTGLISAFEHFKPTYVLTGMALGVDQWAAELCLNLGIPYVAALPFRGQEKKWPPRSQAKFHMLLSRAYQTQVVCEGDYEPWKMQKRNEWMVNSCHMVIAVWNGTPGGTANCVAYATGVGKYVHYVPLPPPGIAAGEFLMKIYGQTKKTTESAPVAEGSGRIVEI